MKKIVCILISVCVILSAVGVWAEETAPKTEINLSFSKEPAEHNPWTDLSYAVTITCPEGEEFYTRGTGYVKGEYVPELDGYYTVKNGDVIELTIPAVYNNYYKEDFEFTYILNVNGENPDIARVALSTLYGKVNQKINPVKIPACIKYDTTSTPSSGSIYIPAGTWVEYMNPDNHNSMKSAKIKLPDGRICWVSMATIWRSDENFTIADTLSDSEREAFVNSMGYESKTPYLVWVNKERQRLTVFLGSKGNWKAVKTFPVATGKNATPTPTVVCEYTYRTRWVTPSYTCDPVLSLYDGYAIHNQPVSPSGYVTDPTIGNPASAGCVRMLKEDVVWVANYVPVKTTVVIY